MAYKGGLVVKIPYIPKGEDPDWVVWDEIIKMLRTRTHKVRKIEMPMAVFKQLSEAWLETLQLGEIYYPMFMGIRIDIVD